MINGTVTLNYLLGPIEDLLGAPQVTEIVCQQPGEVGFEQAGKWYWREIPEFDYRRLDAIGLLSGSLLSKKFDPATPICLSTLPGGQRISLVRPPAVAPGTISLTIRVPSGTVYTVHDDDFEALMREAEARTDRVAPVDAELLDLYHAKRWNRSFRWQSRRARRSPRPAASAAARRHCCARLGARSRPKSGWSRSRTPANSARCRCATVLRSFTGAAGVTAEEAVETCRSGCGRTGSCCKSCGARRPSRICGRLPRAIPVRSRRGTPTATIRGPLSLMAKQHPAGREVPDDKLEKIVKGLIDIVAYCKRDEPGFHVPSVYFRAAENAA